MNKLREIRLPLKKILIPVVALWTVVCLMVVMGLYAVAAVPLKPTGSLSGVEGIEFLSVSAKNSYNNNNGSVSLDRNTITIKAKGYTESGPCSSSTDYDTTTTLTLTNNYSTKATIHYTASNTDPGSGTIDIPAGESYSFTTTSGKGDGATTTGKITINSIAYEVLTMTTTFQTATNGSYTIQCDGQMLEVGQSYQKPSTARYILTATADSGYEFSMWLNADTGEVLSTANPYTAPGGCTIVPKFSVEGAVQYYLDGVPNVYYSALDDAITAAQNSSHKVIVAATSGIVYGSSLDMKEFTIPSGVTLLLPYEAGKTTIDTTTATNKLNGTLQYANKALTKTTTGYLQPQTSVTLELTVPADMTINVASGGKVVVGGTLIMTTWYACTPGGNHANLNLEGTLNIQNGAVLSSCGYILGGGQINAQAGGQLYAPFTILDYRGGGYTTSTNSSDGIKSGEEKITPFSRYTMQNIQTALHMESGAQIYGYCGLYTGEVFSGIIPEQYNVTAPMVVGGANDTALLKLSNGATLDISYNEDLCVEPYPRVGRTILTVNGGASMGALELTISVLGQEEPVSTDGVTFPIPYNYELRLNGTGSTYNISYPLALMPGSSVIVGEGATMNVGSGGTGFRFVVYDGLYDHTGTASGENTATVAYGAGKQLANNNPITSNLQAAGLTGTADLIVNGTLNIGSGVYFGGVVQTQLEYQEDKGYPKVVIDENAGTSATVQVGLVGKVNVVKNYYFAGATVRTLTAQVMDTATGQRVDIVPGKTYYASEKPSVLESYEYTLYTSSADTSLSENHTETLNAELSGSWWNVKIPVSVVDENGTVIGSGEDAKFAEGATLEGTIYYNDSACTIQSTEVNAGTQQIYAKAIVRIQNDTVSKGYLTLADAVAAYGAGTPAVDAENDAGLPYIQMINNTTESGLTIDKPVYLDLNGKTVTLEGELTIASGGALYGMDSATNNYTDTDRGMITGKVMNNGKLATAHETFRNGDGKTRYRYVTLNDTDAGELSFHRYNMSVTKYEFHFRPSGQCDMDFGATFRGSPTVVRLLKDMGFRVAMNGEKPKDEWWNEQYPGRPASEEITDSDRTYENPYILQGTLINIGADGGSSDFTADYSITALLEFDGGTEMESVARVLNYLDALWTYCTAGANDEEKKIIEKFVKDNGLMDAWNSSSGVEGAHSVDPPEQAG